MLLFGVGAMFIITAAYAVFPIVGVILALRLLHGLAWGLSSTAIMTVVADIIPHKRFAEGMGYFAVASAIATAVAPALSIGVLASYGVVPMIAIAAGSTLSPFFLRFSSALSKSNKRKRAGKSGLPTSLTNARRCPPV